MHPLIEARLQARFGAAVTPPSAVKRGHDIVEGTDYPASFDEYVGQHDATTQLRIACTSAQNRGTRLDHVMIASGVAGIGKTTLAQIIAIEMGAGFVSVSGPINVKDARRLLVGMEDGDILFWDEMHLAVQSGKARAEWLLPFLTDHVLMTSTGSETMPDVTVIGATTDVGKLPQTILSRFMIRPTLRHYTPTEGAALVIQLASRMGVKVSGTAIERIALAADNNPRQMRLILTAYRDIVAAGQDDLDLAFQWAGVTPDGLTRLECNVLLVLLDSPDMTAALETIQASLGEPGPLRHSEQTLLQRGLITITGRGRKLTETGMARAIELAQEVAA